MIAYYPDFYPDELTYSLLSRYYENTGYLAYTFVAQDLFVDKRVRPDIEFINHLTKDAFNLITRKMSIEKVVLNHTMFSYYGRFMEHDRRNKAYKSMVSMSGNYHNLLSIPNSKQDRFLRYCPLCVFEDRTKYGETYWHRNHQMMGGNICPKHFCNLINTDVIISGKASPKLISAESIVTDKVKKLESQTIVSYNEMEQKLSRYINDVFNSMFDLCNDTLIGDFLSFKLIGTKYQTGKLRNMRLLTEEFNKCYEELENNPIKELWQIQKILTNRDVRFVDVCMLSMFLNIHAKELCEAKILESFSKEVRKKTCSRNKLGARTKDWNKLDAEFYPKVKLVVKELYGNGVTRPKRVTVFGVEKKLNLPSKSINNMRRCKRHIEKYSETQQQYWVREVEWAIKKLESDGETVNWRHIRNLTNIKRKDFDKGLLSNN